MRLLLLRLVLVVTGALMCLSGVALVLPAGQLQSIAGWFIGSKAAAEVWASGPVFDYVVRVGMAAYLWIGVVLLVAATNPVRHRPQITVAIGALALLTAVCLIAGIVNRLPLLWYLGDAIPCLIAAILLAVLRGGKAQA